MVIKTEKNERYDKSRLLFVSRRLSSLLREIHNLGKSGRIKDGQLSQHLAINLDISFFHFADELAVADAVDPSGCIDPRNPQTAEVAFLLTTIAIGVPQGFHHLLVRDAEETGMRSPEALRQLQNFITTFAGYITALNTSHEFPLHLGFGHKNK